MSTPKSNKKTSMWSECNSCGTIFPSRDSEKHQQNCPPNPDSGDHYYIRNRCLHGKLYIKEDTTGSRLGENDGSVFLSESCMQHCGFQIGSRLVLKVNDLAPIVLKAWPTKQNTLTTVHLTKPVLDLYFGDIKNYPNVMVSKLATQDFVEAQKIILTPIGRTTTKEFTKDIHIHLTNQFKGTLLTVGNKICFFYYGIYLKYSIKEVRRWSRDLVDEIEGLNITDTFYEVTKKSQWCLFVDDEHNGKNAVSQIGGLDQKISEIRHWMWSTLGKIKGEVFCKAVLLHGYPGTGKTMLANALANESGANIIKIKGHSSKGADSRDSIETLLEDAFYISPTVIIVDDVDKRNSDSEITAIEEFLDKVHLKKNAKVFVIGTTNNMDKINPSLLKKNMFKHKIEIPVPNPKARKEILAKILSNLKHNISEDQLTEISSFCTHGFVGSDLEDLVESARRHAVLSSDKILDIKDFEFGLTEVTPSAMKGAEVEVAKVKWSEIAGQEELKLILKQAVEGPLKHFDKYQRMGVKPSNGILMYGPPGCSKTMIAKAVATESRLNFISIKGPELFSKYVGDSEKAVRDVFQRAARVAPSVIFIDEIDAIGGGRTSGEGSADVQTRVLLQLMMEMDGITPLKNVILLAATNRPDKIDRALLRAGRFSKLIYVPLPDDKTRTEIFKMQFNKLLVEPGIDIQALVESTKGYSGAEIVEVCQQAGQDAILEDQDDIKMKNFEKALKKILPVTSKESLKLYEEFSDNRCR